MAAAAASTHAFGASALKAAHQHQQAFTTLGLAGLAVAAGIGFALKAAADAAIAFESSFAGVRKTVDATEAQFEFLSRAIRDMALEIPVGVNELNRIAEAAGQLGIAKEGILGFTETVAKLGATTNIVGDEAATAMARIANVMQTPQDQFDNLGSTIVALGNAGASTESEIVEMAMRIAGAGKVVGLTEAEVLSFANALSSVGIEAQMGGTAISRVFVDIASAVESGGERLEQFAQVAGMSGAEFQQAFGQDAAGAMVSFIEGLGRIDAAGGNVFGTLEELGLSEVRIRDALLRAAGAGDLFRESLELGSRAWEENTALNEEAAKRFGTTASQAQLMRNEINDAAISFGLLLLPAIAAVMGAVGDFAALIGGLPGPVKAAVMVLALAAAGMMLLGGATLLLLPRIAAAKLAMAQMGVQGGLLRGSLGLAAKAINPLTIGLTAATIVVGAYAQSKAEAEARTKAFTSAIEADTGALGENTKALLLDELASAGLLERFKEMGLNLDEVADQTIEFAGGSKEAAEATRDLVESMSGPDAVAFVGILDALTLGVDRYALKTEALGGAHELTADAAARQARATGDLGGELEEAVSLADQLTEALEALAGVAMDVNEAELNWLDTLATVKKELREGARTLDINTQAGRDNQNTIRDGIDAAIAHGAAVAEQTGSVEKGARVVREHVNALMAEAVEAGISKSAIQDYIDTLNLTPKDIRTAIRLLGIPEASRELGIFFETWNGRTINVNLGVTTPSEIGAPEFHGGGLASDEMLGILQRGEHVTDKDTASRHRGLLRALPRLHHGGPVPQFSTRGLTPDEWRSQYRMFTRIWNGLEGRISSNISSATPAVIDAALVKTKDFLRAHRWGSPGFADDIAINLQHMLLEGLGAGGDGDGDGALGGWDKFVNSFFQKGRLAQIPGGGSGGSARPGGGGSGGGQGGGNGNSGGGASVNVNITTGDVFSADLPDMIEEGARRALVMLGRP